LTRFIVFIAALLSARQLARGGLEAAFLKVWIPFFLMIPTTFFVNIPGLPDPNFAQAAIIPILVVLLRDRLPDMGFGRMELLLLCYFLLRVGMDFYSRGYSDAQNYGFYMATSLIGPYLLGRYVIDRREMDIATAQMFVFIFILFFPMFVYELKFWVSPVFTALGRFFPYAGSGLSLRWGVARTAGTFTHPILACIMVIAVYRLHRWLSWQGVWDRPQEGWLGRLQRWSKPLPFAFKHKVTIALILMALMTISRGPWIGGLAGAALTMVGNFKNRKLWLGLFVAGMLAGGVAGKMALDAYTSPDITGAISGEAQTMLYRKVMLEEYKAFLLDRLWTGWGLTTVPEVPGMESVDNAYFLMALQHGILAPIVFVVIFLYAIASQIKFGLKAPVGESPIGFTFAGIYLMAFVSFATVYMGAQTEPMLFLLLGWGESIKNRSERAAPDDADPPDPDERKGPFRRVID
jgi:hypothetical protein